MLAPLAALWLAAAPAPTPRPALEATLRQFARLVELRDLALSPDGKRVAWVHSLNGPHGPLHDRSALWVLDLATPGARPVRVTTCPGARGCDEGTPVFSPDGRTLAFLADPSGAGQPQLFLAPAGGGAPRRLSALSGALSDLRWSPDGSALAVLVVEGDPSAAGPLGPAARDLGEVQAVVHEQRIAVLPVRGGPAALVSPADLFVYEYDWSPDGAAFAYTAAHGSGDDNWWIAELFTQPASGGPATLRYHPALQLAMPRWSPDGKALAFIEGLMSDEGLTAGEVMLLPAEGGPPRNLTPGRASSPGWLRWTGPDSMLLLEWAQGETALTTLGVRDGKAVERWRGPKHLGPTPYALGAALAADGDTLAVAMQGFDQPAEVFTGRLSAPGAWVQRSRLNEGQTPGWGAVRSLRWKSDGFEAQGWLVAPPKVEPGRLSPMITVVHGGPAWAVPARFSEEVAALASAGYHVFLPNPRGSFGQGQAYTRANVQDFGGGDLRDVLAGVDAALAAAPIDPRRLGITGWSYGGYLTMWAVTQTRRFGAAVAGAGIANWQSYAGQNQIDTWMLPFFGGSIYERPEVYRKSSPIEFITAVRTPTLVLQGELDAEVPAPQAREFWHALKALKVPTSLVIYEGEGHVFRKPEHQRDRYARMLDWFDRYLSPRGPDGG